MKPLENPRNLLARHPSFSAHRNLSVVYAIKVKTKFPPNYVQRDFELASPQRGCVQSIQQHIRNLSEWLGLQEVLLLRHPLSRPVPSEAIHILFSKKPNPAQRLDRSEFPPSLIESNGVHRDIQNLGCVAGR
jgi:hypothetical protein